MKLELFRYEENKTYQIIEEIDSSSFSFPEHYKIKKINSCTVECNLTRFEQLTRVRVKIKGDLTAVCSYTGEDFIFPFKTSEEMSFSNLEEDTTSYHEPNDVINLDPYIVAIIDSLVPLNVRKPNAQKPKDGEGYRVLTEEELKKERSSSKDSRWDVLDQLDLD